jgi:lipoate-protein ligase A
MSFKLKILKFEKLDPFLNMAIDEANLLYNDKNEIILRFFGWNRPSVSIGLFQKISEINFEYLKKEKIPLVRRPTGGKGVFHYDELTYSLIIPSNHPIYELNTIESYKIISMAFIESLLNFNIKGGLTKKFGETHGFCFASQNYYEISVDGCKIIGSAQRRKKEGILQQGSIPFRIDYDKTKKIFFLEKINGFKSIKEIDEKIEIENLEDSLIKSFIKLFDVPFEIKKHSEEKIPNLEKILNEKYLKDSWNLYGYVD